MFGRDEEDGVPVPLTVPVVLLDAPPDVLPRLDFNADLGVLMVEPPIVFVVALAPAP